MSNDDNKLILITGAYPSKKGLTVYINMQNDEKTDEIQVEQQENQEVVVEETTTVEPTAEETSAEETPEDKLAKAQAEAAKYRRLFEKTQTKPQVAKPKEPQTVSPQLNVEETVLLANGMDEELLTKLKTIAKVEGINSLIKAQNNPIFVAVKEKFEKDKKSKDASLPASRGSGHVKAEKSTLTPGLSREEHQALVKKTLGL